MSRDSGTTVHLPQTVDQILSTPMTSAQRAAYLAPYSITHDGTITQEHFQAYLYMLANVFRAWSAIAFDTPMPLTGATTPGGWFQAQGLPMVIGTCPGNTSGAACAEGGTIYIPGPTDGVHAYSLATIDSWSDPAGRQAGLGDVGSLLFHEAWHIVGNGGHGIGHNCDMLGAGSNVYDSSLAYNGAWAIEYYYSLWMAEHTGNALSAAEQRAASAEATNLLRTRFCDTVARAEEIIFTTWALPRQ